MEPIALFFLFALVVTVVLLVSWFLNKLRRDAMAAEAHRLGLQFSADDIFQIPEAFAHFSDFTQGHSRRASNVMYGKRDGQRVLAFDYRYVTGSGKHQTTHRFSAAILTCDCVFRGLRIRPENFLDKLAAVVGFDDIDFESDEFSRRFHVQGDDRKFAYAVIHPRMMEFLLADPDWSLAMAHHDILLRYGTGTWDVKRFAIAMEFIRRFLELIPEYVWKDLGLRAEHKEAVR